MEYTELFSRYEQLIQRLYEKKTELSTLAEGYVSAKKISGRSYYYLQKRHNKKMHSSYIKPENLKNIKNQLAVRNVFQKEIFSLSEEISKIEQAALVLSPTLHRQMLQRKRATKMDAISITARGKSLSFSSAMLSLEGVNPSPAAKKSLKAWGDGKASFSQGYQNVLAKYNLTGGNRL